MRQFIQHTKSYDNPIGMGLLCLLEYWLGNS